MNIGKYNECHITVTEWVFKLFGKEGENNDLGT